MSPRSSSRRPPSTIDSSAHCLSRPRRAPVIPTESIPSAESILPERNLRPDSSERAREPQTEMERMIASVWQELLGVPQVVVRDNFL